MIRCWSRRRLSRRATLRNRPGTAHPRYRLHGFSQSGNTFKVAFLLRALNAPWEARFVDFMNGVTRTGEWREGTGWANPYDILPGEYIPPKW